MFRCMEEAPKDGTFVRLVFKRLSLTDIQMEGRELRYRYLLSKKAFYWDDKRNVWLADTGEDCVFSTVVGWCYYAPRAIPFDKELTETEFNKFVAKRRRK